MLQLHSVIRSCTGKETGADPNNLNNPSSSSSRLSCERHGNPNNLNHVGGCLVHALGDEAWVLTEEEWFNCTTQLDPWRDTETGGVTDALSPTGWVSFALFMLASLLCCVLHLVPTP